MAATATEPAWPRSPLALPEAAWENYPARIRVIARRERPHPGAQLDAFEERDGWRYTAFATDTQVGQLAHLDARHRAHARVEDRIRCAKGTGLDHLPRRAFTINQAWLNVVMLAVDLIAWTHHLLLSGDLAKAEPKTCATGYRTSRPGSVVASVSVVAGVGSGCVSGAAGRGSATLVTAVARLGALPVPSA